MKINVICTVALIVGAVRAIYIVFGSDYSKSTIFGIDVA